MNLISDTRYGHVAVSTIKALNTMSLKNMEDNEAGKVGTIKFLMQRTSKVWKIMKQGR